MKSCVFLDDNSTGNGVSLDAFEVGISWRDVAFKVDGLKKGFNHMTDWTLNQVHIHKTSSVNFLKFS
jgi:hypothetical protein